MLSASRSSLSSRLGSTQENGNGCPERMDVQGSGKVWPAPRTGELALYKQED